MHEPLSQEKQPRRDRAGEVFEDQFTEENDVDPVVREEVSHDQKMDPDVDPD